MKSFIFSAILWTLGNSVATARYYDSEAGRFISADSIVSSPMDPQSLNRYTYVRNNPTVLTDPSGHSWLSKNLDKFSNWASQHKEFVGLSWQALDVMTGSTYLGSFDNGRAILAGQVIAAGAFSAGGTQVGWGAISGEASSVYATRQTGGNMLTSVIRGGLEGAAISGTYARIGSSRYPWAIRGLAKATMSAGLTRLHGGDVGSAWISAGILFAAEAANSYFTKIAGYGADPTPGTELDSSDRSYDTPKPPFRKNVIGFNGGYPNNPGSQGSLMSRSLNVLPGGNAVAEFHDSLLLDFPSLQSQPLNAFTILPSIPFAYLSQFSGPFSPLISLIKE